MSVLEKDLNPDVFIGISLPLNHNSQGFFKKTRTTLEQTRHNIKNLLLTIKGERLGNPTFGSDLYRVLFEQMDGNTNSKIEETIRSSISEWLPYVNIVSINIEEDAQYDNTLRVLIDFSIDVDQTVARLDLDLRTADKTTIGGDDGETMWAQMLNDGEGGLIGPDEYDTLDPFYSL